MNNTFANRAAALWLLLAAPLTSAQDFVINNATVYPGDGTGPLTNVSVAVDNGVITAVANEPLTAATTIDAEGKILTPGFIGSLNPLGLVEVGAVDQSEDNAAEKSDLGFNPGLAYNPQSTTIALARSGGITGNVMIPQASSKPIAGVASAVSLTGEFSQSPPKVVAAVLYLAGKKKAARGDLLAQFEQHLRDALHAIDKASSESDDEEPKAPAKPAEIFAEQLIAGDLPLLAISDRPADILQLLRVKEEFGLRLIVGSADGAVAVAEQLAAAQVPVIIDPLSNLPASFDSLHASLDNAGLLNDAGVTVGMAVLADSAHNLYQLRFSAGNAVAHELPKAKAIAGISGFIADMFGLEAGIIAPGKPADLALWSGDPLDVSGSLDALWIAGQQQSTRTRADALRDRYLQSSGLLTGEKAELPPAYLR